MIADRPRFSRILVAGATGFVGRALVPALLERGYQVRACARHVSNRPKVERLEYAACDLLDPTTLPVVLAGMDAAFYLVHSMGGPRGYREEDRRAASTFAVAARMAGVKRIIYLGGVAPAELPSEHLASRVEVGQILRDGEVPTLELRAAMIVGEGSASWQIVRDLVLRLPAMVLPAWLESKLCPIAIEDVVQALLDGLELDLSESACFDVPGPDALSGRQILERIAALEGRRLPVIALPWLTPKLSALWLRITTGANFQLARELVLGLEKDLLPRDRRYWELTGHPPRWTFDAAVRRTLEEERRKQIAVSPWVQLAEALVRRASPRVKGA